MPAAVVVLASMSMPFRRRWGWDPHTRNNLTSVIQSLSPTFLSSQAPFSASCGGGGPLRGSPSLLAPLRSSSSVDNSSLVFSRELATTSSLRGQTNDHAPHCLGRRISTTWSSAGTPQALSARCLGGGKTADLFFSNATACGSRGFAASSSSSSSDSAASSASSVDDFDESTFIDKGKPVFKVLEQTVKPFTKEDIVRDHFAVFEVGSHQFKVTPDDVIFVEKLWDVRVNNVLTFPKVLLYATREETHIGRPYVLGARVRCVVEEQMKNARVWIFKKKRRNNYRRFKGYRHPLTALRVLAIDPPEGASEPV